MGRHSAPDGDRSDVDPPDDAATLTLIRSAGLAGRHALAENAEPIAEVQQTDLAADDQATVVIPIEIAGPAPATSGAARRERKQSRWERGTGADLRMLRHNTAIRLQCIAAVAIAFGGYTAVMGVLGRDARSYLMWVWVPIVLSGVLVGGCLDLAHHRADRQSAAGEEPDPGNGAESAGGTVRR